MTDIIRKNSSFETLKLFSNIFTGNPTSLFDNQYTNLEVMAFQYDPITSVDIERTFSMYKNLLISNRQRFTFENIHHIFVIFFNEALNNWS